MGSYAQPKLPVIAFNDENLNPRTVSWRSTSQSVRQALESYGCFIGHFDKIPLELHELMFKFSKELFDLPVETKLKNTSLIAGFGYGGNFPALPLFEYSGIENGATLEAIQNFTSLMWPSGNDSFIQTVLSYSKLLAELDNAVLQMVTSSYGLEKYYKPLTQSSFYLTRFMKYRVPKENDINVGLVPHTDKSFMAVVDTNHVKGLQIETRYGEWIDFEPSPSNFLVIAGEPFMAWTNGRVRAPLHRVIMKGDEEKYTIAQFSFARGKLQVPKELVDDDNPLKYKSFDHMEFLEYCKSAGAKMRRAIQAFCGI